MRTGDALNALQFLVAYLRCLSHRVHSVSEESIVRICNYLGYSSLLMFNMPSVTSNMNACFKQEFWILT
jgi:hypothetical protein